MATRKKKKAAQGEGGENSQSKVKLIAGAVGVVVLLVGGFLLGIYLKLLDPNEMNEKYGIYEWPIVGEHFVAANQDGEGLEADTDAMNKKAIEDNKKKEAEAKESKPIKLTKEEIEQKTKELQAAEKKRIGKLSRLYNEMKPDEAAKILTALDDEMLISILQKMDESQVSQILANEAFGADRAADITRKMYAGTPKRVANPNDEE